MKIIAMENYIYDLSMSYVITVGLLEKDKDQVGCSDPRGR